MNIAITGSVACGKSTVTKYLKEKGYNIIDADKIGHSVLDNECVIANIVKTFGESVTTFDNKIDRKKLGRVVFSDEEKIKKLNSITHPLIEDEIKKQQNNFYKTHKEDEICILDIALIFEAKMTHLVDKIITVHSDYNVQLMRLKERNNISEEYAKEIIAKQLSSCEKKKLADFVVDNSNSIEETYKQVDEIFKKILGGSMTLVVKNLTGGYNRKTVIEDVSFNIKSGSITALIGLNGAGKSTTIKHILGLLKAKAGDVSVLGKKTTEDDLEYRKNITYIPESPILYEELTLKEHINLTAMAYSLDKDVAWSRANKLLEIFKLKDKLDFFPIYFSKGMKQKVMIICAFLVEPSLYIIDEPFLGLDPIAISDLIKLMCERKNSGASILMSTHILQTAEKYCDNFIIMHKGRIIADGSLDSLREEFNMQDASLDEIYLHLTEKE